MGAMAVIFAYFYTPLVLFNIYLRGEHEVVIGW